MPGPICRPVLVREVELREFADKTQFGALLISYGSGQGIDAHSRLNDLVIEDREYRAAGLHKTTRFSLDPRDRKLLPWCEEYFVAPEYVRSAALILGRLTEKQRDRLKAAIQHRADSRA